MAAGGVGCEAPGIPGVTPRPSGMLGTVLALRCCAAGWTVDAMPAGTAPLGPFTPSCLHEHFAALRALQSA